MQLKSLSPPVHKEADMKKALCIALVIGTVVGIGVLGKEIYRDVKSFLGKK